MPKRFNFRRSEFSKFRAHCDKEIEPFLESKESERKFRLVAGLITAALLTPVGIFLAWYFTVVSENSDGDALHFAYAVPMLGFMLVMFGLRRKTKLHLVKSIAGFLGWEHSQNEKADPLINKLRRFGLYPEYSNLQIDDVLRGEHLGWPFQIVEVHLQKYKGWGRNRRLETIHRGYLLSFTMAVDTMPLTRITHSHGTLPASWPGKPDLFSDHYTDSHGEVYVHSTDKDALDAIMCDRFKSALIELDAAFPKFVLACLMDENNLHIPIAADNQFEIDWMFKAMNDPERVQKMLNEFSGILDMLDILLRRRACNVTGERDFPKFRKPCDDNAKIGETSASL